MPCRRDTRSERGGCTQVEAPATEGGITLDLDALAEHAAERLAREKLPRRFEVRGELPKTPTGKISKGPLREQFGRWTTSTRAAAEQETPT